MSGIHQSHWKGRNRLLLFFSRLSFPSALCLRTLVSVFLFSVLCFLAWIEIDAQVLLHFLYYITSIRGVLARKLKLPFELVFFIR